LAFPGDNVKSGGVFAFFGHIHLALGSTNWHILLAQVFFGN